MTDKLRHKSISRMVHAVSENKEFVESFDRLVASRQLVKQLVALRCAKGLRQEDVAKFLSCTQSKVAKLENGDDASLRIGEVREYANALGLDLQIGLIPQNVRITDKIKYHAFAIRKLLRKLVELAHLDTEIAKAIAGFHGETFLNLLAIVKKSADGLPKNPDNERPFLRIEVIGAPEHSEGDVVEDEGFVEPVDDPAAMAGTAS